MGKRIDLVKKLQKEMDRRTEIENVAVQLISEGKCEEATALLSSLDDNVVKEIVDELERAVETISVEIKVKNNTEIMKDGSIRKIIEKIQQEIKEVPHVNIKIKIT